MKQSMHVGPAITMFPCPRPATWFRLIKKSATPITTNLSSISDEIRDGVVLIKQACFRPIVEGRGRDMGPLVGPTGIRSLWLAAGHDSWGIQNGLAIGLVMSEMLFEGKARSAGVTSLDPRRVLSVP